MIEQVAADPNTHWHRVTVTRWNGEVNRLFSLVTLIADRLVAGQAMPVRTSAWYRKTQPTFSDALALVRRHLWSAQNLSTSWPKTDIEKPPNPLLARFVELLCYAT